MNPDLKQNLYLLGTLLLIIFLWNQPFLYPLKIFVVFFHELSHAIMTLLTGGEVIEMVINAQQGGHVISAGGNRFLTLSAGYLGSLLWGVSIYWLAVQFHIDRMIMFFLGLIVLMVTLFFISNLFALIFCLISGICMVGLAYKASAEVNDFVLRIIGMTNMLYVPLDIFSDTLARSHLRSDARMLAEEIGGSTIIWGSLWMIISILIIFGTLKYSKPVKNKKSK